MSSIDLTVERVDESSNEIATNMHTGQWLVRVYERNLPAIPFWRKAISRYAQDRQIEERRIVNGKAWSHFKSHAA